MSSKQKSAKDKTNTSANEVVVFRASRFGSSRLVSGWLGLKLWLRFSLVAVVLIAGVLVAVVLTHHSAAPPRYPLPPNVSDDYSGTELTNLPLLLNHDYGLTENDVMHGNLHHELKSFQEAWNVAIAIARLGDRHRSLDAYKIAVSKAPNTIDSSFYVEVMGVSYQMGDPQYGDQMYQKAVAAIQNSKEMTAAEKQHNLAHLKGLYELTKAGQDS